MTQSKAPPIVPTAPVRLSLVIALCTLLFISTPSAEGCWLTHQIRCRWIRCQRAYLRLTHYGLTRDRASLLVQGTESHRVSELVSLHRKEIESYIEDHVRFFIGFQTMTESLEPRILEPLLEYFLGGFRLKDTQAKKDRRFRFYELMYSAGWVRVRSEDFQQLNEAIGAGTSSPISVADTFKTFMSRWIASHIPGNQRGVSQLYFLTNSLHQGMKGSIFQNWLMTHYLKGRREVTIPGESIGREEDARIDSVSFRGWWMWEYAVAQEHKHYTRTKRFGSEQIKQLEDYRLIIDHNIQIEGRPFSHVEYYFSTREVAMKNWETIMEHLGDYGVVYYLTPNGRFEQVRRRFQN